MTIDIQRTVSLDAPIVPEVLRGALYQTEQMAHKFVITAKRDGATVDMTGATVSGLVILADGQTKELLPSADMAGVESGKAWVTFGAGCYTVPGRFGLTVFATQDGAKTCVYACVGTIQRTQNGTPTVPEDTIPDAATLAEMIEQCETAISENLYPVSYVAQTLLATEKAQARANIGAASELMETDEIPDTVQSIVFDGNGNVQSITHKKRTDQSVTVRTDAFVFAGSTITEVRALASGETLTIVTDTDTLITTVTYAAA